MVFSEQMNVIFITKVKRNKKLAKVEKKCIRSMMGILDGYTRSHCEFQRNRYR